MEDMKQTQRTHSAMLQSMHQMLQKIAGSQRGTEERRMPENLNFPLSSEQDVDLLESLMADSGVKNTLVRDT